MDAHMHNLISLLILLLLSFFLLFLSLGSNLFKKAKGSGISKRISMIFGSDVLHVNTHRLMESAFSFDVIISRWRPRHYFTQNSAATWWVKTKRLRRTPVPDLWYIRMVLFCRYSIQWSCWRHSSLTLCLPSLWPNLTANKPRPSSSSSCSGAFCESLTVSIFSARQHICYSALYAMARPSVRPSVCHTGGSVKDGWSWDHATFTTK